MSASTDIKDRIPDEVMRDMVTKARDRHLLSDVISRHTDLKSRGKREMVGLCPFHLEKTPSFEVNDDKGTYHCWGCGSGGDAIKFLMDKEGMNFILAVETLSGEEFPVISDEERARRKAENAEKLAQRMALARGIWSQGVDPAGTPAEVYARARGILGDLPRSVRFAMLPRYRNAETGEVGRYYPALVCAIQDVDGPVVGVQCVFLENGGRRKYSRPTSDGKPPKAKYSYGLIQGNAFRTGPTAESIICCEGPEDGLTLAQLLPGKTVWVTCGTEGLSRLKFPNIVKTVILAGDNGEAGRAAVARAHTVYSEQGLAVQEVFPDPQFKDWNDQLRGVRLDGRDDR
ncbi:CHC2 zinc finger domain-containing protein [Novosphingobium sp.]|uniref:CHC2 zinc finger domain-containing protein n=1 Tax=Novosphingobium sp. TaxID=1874826 RepID=UPI003D1207B5